nr:MAG TPA: hypothetical protein [Caudoviricetes sp.]
MRYQVITWTWGTTSGGSFEHLALYNPAKTCLNQLRRMKRCYSVINLS